MKLRTTATITFDLEVDEEDYLCKDPDYIARQVEDNLEKHIPISWPMDLAELEHVKVEPA